MIENDLETIAKALVAPGKGILAADESFPTIEKRFKPLGIESTEETRRAYREMLITAPGLNEFISGVILFDETLRQKAGHGVALSEVMRTQGIIPGIKVDKGAKPLAGFPGEKITEGLDGLRERLQEYRLLGAQFTKWRAVFSVGDGIPSRTGRQANAEALARFAALSQENGLVPIVEPEVLMDGRHSIEQAAAVTESVLHLVFHTLSEHKVRLEQMLLKPNMVVPGQDSSAQTSVREVAAATLQCLRRTVPSAVPGIVFLSGGQDDVLATKHLNALNTIGGAPWELSFSFGRALQAPALATWRGDPAQAPAGQQALLHRARCNSFARAGKYFEEMERDKSPEPAPGAEIGTKIRIE